MALGDVFRIALVTALHESRLSSTWFVEETALFTGTQPSLDIGVDFVANVMAPLQDLSADELQFCNVEVHHIKGTPKQSPSLELLVAEVGNITGQAMPASSVIQFQHRQLTATSRNNGAINWSGVPEADTVGNDYDLTARAVAIQQYKDAILAGLDAAGGAANGHWEFMVESKVLSGGGTPANPNYHQVTSVHINGLMYNQRLRGRDHKAVAP